MASPKEVLSKAEEDFDKYNASIKKNTQDKKYPQGTAHELTDAGKMNAIRKKVMSENDDFNRENKTTVRIGTNKDRNKVDSITGEPIKNTNMYED